MARARYLDDSSIRQFDATIERVLDDRVVLDGTHFYPEGGGQPADHGTIESDGDTWRVVDVRKRDTIYHTVVPEGEDQAMPEEGATVSGSLDWDRRYAHMRYHTAQHLLSALLLDRFDAPTIGNQLYHDRARIDVGYDRFDSTELAVIEDGMNDRIAAALPVTWYTMDREEAESTLDPERTRIDLLPDSIRRLRIVEIEGTNGELYDRTACAGTHVETTAELGRFRATGRTTRGSDAERLSFVLESDVADE